MSAARTVVIGGGIAGLAAALRSAQRGDDVVVVESSPTVGGKLAGHVVDGLTLDAGAESLLARRPEGLDVIAACGRASDLVHPARSGAGLWLDELADLPRQQLLGIPTDVSDPDLLAVLGPDAVARLTHEPPLGAAMPSDMTVAELVGGQLGDAVVDRLVEPLLGGVYAGRADQISVEAALPGLLDHVVSAGTLVGGAAAMRARSTGEGPVFASVVGGLGSLPRSLASASGVTVMTSTVAADLRGASGDWSIELEGGQTMAAERLVIAVPGFAAAPLLASVARVASTTASELDYATVALITAVFDAGSVTADLKGTGFLVPPASGRLTKAATFVSRKWQWVADAAPGREVLRFSVGRHGDQRGLELSDADLTAAVLDEVTGLLGLTEGPRASTVTRWERSLPQYRVGHRERVTRVRASLPLGIAIAGAAWDGVGIPACIASGWAAADRVAGAESDG
ncbi:MAG TPA: protoporphyrinogen oxidase [Actinomycetes bacterium]|nr:protoporphyrinogen oxidase [Actinomycetes bacterium]